MKRWFKRLVVVAILVGVALGGYAAFRSFFPLPEIREARRDEAILAEEVEATPAAAMEEEVERIDPRDATIESLRRRAADLAARLAARDAGTGAGTEITGSLEVTTEEVAGEVVCPPTQPGRPPVLLPIVVGPGRFGSMTFTGALGSSAVVSGDMEVWVGNTSMAAPLPIGRLYSLPVSSSSWKTAPAPPLPNLPRTLLSFGLGPMASQDGLGWEFSLGLLPASWAWKGRLGEARAGLELDLGRVETCWGGSVDVSVPSYDQESPSIISRETSFCGDGWTASLKWRALVGFGARLR